MAIDIYDDSSTLVGIVDDRYICRPALLGNDRIGHVSSWRVYSTEGSKEQVAVVKNDGYIDGMGGVGRIGWIDQDDEIHDVDREYCGYIEGNGSEEERGAAAAALLTDML